MAQQEDTPIHASMLALGCGLGKTVTALLSILIINDRQMKAAAEHPEEKQTYQASLVICPGQSVEIWQLDIEKFFPKRIKVRQFYRTLATTTNNRRQKTLIDGGVDVLNKTLQALDPDDPEVCAPC
jgi:SNF2 family DNA or RNA helicase